MDGVVRTRIEGRGGRAPFWRAWRRRPATVLVRPARPPTIRRQALVLRSLRSRASSPVAG